MAFQNIKRNGQTWKVESADQLNAMTEKIDLAIDMYEHKDLEYRFRGVTYFKQGYKIGNIVVLNGIVNDGDKIPFAPSGRNQFFTGTENSSGNMVVVEVTTRGRIKTSGKDVTVFGQWII